jgi:hypothetical protein
MDYCPWCKEVLLPGEEVSIYDPQMHEDCQALWMEDNDPMAGEPWREEWEPWLSP